MAQKRERRQSGLAASTPASPAALSVVRAASEVPAVDPAPMPAAPAKPKTKSKVSFYQEEADTDRVRAAYKHTNAAEGFTSFSDLINVAVLKYVEDLEQKHNGGVPWPPVKAGSIPRGKPVGL